MNENEFLYKYGGEKVLFTVMDKYKAIYQNDKLGIFCSGIVNYRDSICHEETVMDIFNLDCFEFGFIQESEYCDKRT